MTTTNNAPSDPGTNTRHDLPFGISLVDTGLVRSRFAASYLLEDAGAAAFVEAGPVSGIPRLLAALDERGIERAAVHYVIVTHVHLDHAAGAGALLAQLPNAKLVVHPRGARHMIDPSRLIAGATAVYGEDQLRATFGIPSPIDAERVVSAADGHEIRLGRRSLVIFDTPGHALHHVVVFDKASRGFFCGDMFGLRYPELDSPSRAFVFPTTTPVQFDPKAMHESIDRMMRERPERMYFTHFGVVEDPIEPLAADLHRLIDRFVAIAHDAGFGTDRHQRIVEGLASALLSELDVRGCVLPSSKRREFLSVDLELNAQGLGVWLDNAAKAKSHPADSRSSAIVRP